MVEILKTGKVTHISLDHDLGSGVAPGYGVLTWIEEQVFTNPSYVPPTIFIHTANPSAKDKMMAARHAIFREIARRGASKAPEDR